MGFITGVSIGVLITLCLWARISAASQPEDKFCSRCKHCRVSGTDLLCTKYPDVITGLPTKCSMVREYSCKGKHYEKQGPVTEREA